MVRKRENCKILRFFFCFFELENSLSIVEMWNCRFTKKSCVCLSVYLGFQLKKRCICVACLNYIVFICVLFFVVQFFTDNYFVHIPSHSDSQTNCWALIVVPVHTIDLTSLAIHRCCCCYRLKKAVNQH